MSNPLIVLCQTYTRYQEQTCEFDGLFESVVNNRYIVTYNVSTVLIYE